MNGKAIYLIFPLAMIILGGAITDALAATLAGKVAIVRGKVTAVAEDGQKRNLAAKSPIYVNDTIETAANSQAQILFEDETVYTIGPQSDLKIDQFVYNPEKSVGDLVVGATKGSFRMITGSIAKKTPDRVKVRTPVATIGIRGTYFAGIFNGATLNTLLVGGAIFVDNPAGGREIRTPGFGTKVHSNAAPPEPAKKFTQQEIKQILAPTELMAMAPASNTADGTTTTAAADGTTTTTTANGTTATTTADGTTATMTLADPSLSAQTPSTNTTTTTTVVIQTPPSQPVTTIPTYSLGGKYVGAAGTTIWTGGVSGSALATDTVRNYSLTYGGSLANLSLNAPVVNSTATPYTVQGPYSFPAQNFWGYSYPAGSAWYDGRGEFSYFISPGTNQFAGYAGAPIGSAVAPTSGIGIYYGRAAAVFTDGSHEADKMRLYINWGTNKVFGSIGDRLQDQIFVKGIYDPLTKTITNAAVFGKGLAGAGAEEFVSSNPFSMAFFGSAMQGIGGIVTGFDKNVAGTTIYDWNAMTAAIGDRNAVLTPRTNNESAILN
ncbi:MAG: FecR domain-containing protein, partial [Nitrospirota bacterium]|nr:FecR domain-containing protein [Nitrospirota bacterium]